MNYNLTELSALIRIMNFSRLLNLLKIYFAFYYSKYSHTYKFFGKPFSISVEPTTACNLRCPQCVSGLKSFTRPEGKMDFELFCKSIDAFSPELFYLNLYFQGEPYLHPDFFKMIQYAKMKNIFVMTSTNGHFLDKESAIQTVDSGLDKLIISVDGIDQNTYQKYRIGGKLTIVQQGIRNLVQAKKEKNSKTPLVIIQFIVFAHNENQMEEFKKEFESYGVDDIVFKSAQIYEPEKNQEWLPQKQKFSRYRRDGQLSVSTIQNSFHLNIPSNRNYCWKSWHSSVITWDGKVLPCCFDKDAKHEMGNLFSENLETILDSKNYSNFRKKILNSRESIDICRNCSEGLKVWI